MKKTLLVTLDFYPSVGGISNYWISLGKHMPPDRWIVLAPPLPSGCRELATLYRIVRLPFLSAGIYPHWLPLFFSLLRILFREHIEVIIVGQILPVGTVVYFFSRLFGIPYVVSTHGMDITLPFRTTRKRNLCRKIFLRAKKIIVNSAYTAKKITEYGIDSSKIDFIYPCPALVPGKEYIPRPPSKKEIIILTVGRIVKRKGHEYVLGALSELREHIPPIYYIVVGDGPEKEHLANKAKALGIAEQVLFTGPLADEAVKQWYKKCDMFIMAPYEIDGDVEGFGIVYLEANAFGKPVIASRSGGIGDAVIDEKTGILIESRNTVAIRDAVTRLIDDHEFALLLGKHGKQRVEKEFQWNVQAGKLHDIINVL